MIDTVFFDAVGTLIEVAEPVGETYARVARAAGFDADAAALTNAFRVRFAAAPPLAFPRAAPAALRPLEREWWRERVLETFAEAGVVGPPERFDRAFRAAFDHFARASAWRVFDDVGAALRALRTLGLRLAVISNFDARLRSILRELELAPAFDAVVLSSECGFAKPDRRIFEHALRTCGTQASSTLHVGDSRNHDVEGPRRAGIAAIRIDRAHPTGTDTIADLGELVARLTC